MAIQATRGCPYKCYCDILTRHQKTITGDLQNTFFNEVRRLADIGVKRFEFIDDIFNEIEKAVKVFELMHQE